MHWKRRHSAGCPEMVVNRPMSPEISTSAEASTFTSMVHLPFPPPPVIVARRDTGFACAVVAQTTTISAAHPIPETFGIKLFFICFRRSSRSIGQSMLQNRRDARVPWLLKYLQQLAAMDATLNRANASKESTARRNRTTRLLTSSHGTHMQAAAS